MKNSKLRLGITKSNIYNMIINDFKKDGVLCDPYSKYYDEKGTFQGGISDRKFFKYNNDLIIGYHAILSVFKGERRANIREAIPVIDYMTIENTDIMSTYAYTDTTCTDIDPTIITAIPEVAKDREKDSAYEYILNEDPYILNRVVSGSPLMEYFYNTSDENPSESGLQVSSYTGRFSYIYNGIKSKSIRDSFNNPYESLRTTTIQVRKLNKPNFLEYNPSNEAGSCNPGYTDSKGTLFPDENTTLGETTFVRKITGDKYSLTLDIDDILVLIPGAPYSADANKLLVLKKNPDSVASVPDRSEASEGNAPSYSGYIIYLSNVDLGMSLQEVTQYSNLPSYLISGSVASPGNGDNLSIIDFLSKYLKVKKEYYSNAPGLLNGYFCKPKEYSKSPNGGTKVETWIFAGDADIARKNDVIIDIGSKYNPNHLLSRGIPIVSPLQLTPSDPKYDANGNPYEGKATLIYDKILGRTNDLFNTVQIPKNIWPDFPLCTVDSVLKKADYAGSMIPKSAYKSLLGSENSSTIIEKVMKPNKLKRDGRALTPEDFEEYIDACSSCLESISEDNSEYRLKLDFINNSEVCCYNTTIKENATFLNFGWAVKTKETIGTGNIMDSNFLSAFYASWNYRWKYKRRSTADTCECLSLKVSSPIKTFAKTVMAPPISVGSQVNLAGVASSALGYALAGPFGGLFGAVHSGGWSNKQLVPAENIILIYPEYNNLFPTELFLISSIDLKLEPFVEPAQGDSSEVEDARYSRGMCSFYNPKDGGKILSFRVDKVATFLPSRVTQVVINDPYSRQTITRDIAKGTFGIDEDCYIYTLKPMIMSMEGIDIRDSHDRLIETSNGVSDVALVPMSYPSESFFPVTSRMIPSEDGEPAYEYIVDQSNRAKDIKYLEGAYIIPGIPEFNSPDEFLNLKKNGLDLSIFSKLFGEDGIGEITNRALMQGIRYILDSWPISDGKKNPIELRNMTPILDGLVEVKPYLYRLVSERFRIPREVEENGVKVKKMQRITAKELSNFFSRIDTDSDYTEYNYTVTKAPTPPAPGLSDTTLAKYLKNPLNSISISANGTSRYYERPSLQSLSLTLKKSIYANGNLTREACREVDKYFGNNTAAFLEMGDPLQDETTPSSVLTATEEVKDNIEEAIKNYDISFKNDLLKDLINATTGDAYRKYYNDNLVRFNWEVVEASSSETDGVTTHYMKINKKYDSSIYNSWESHIMNSGNSSSYNIDWSLMSGDKSGYYPGFGPGTDTDKDKYVWNDGVTETFKSWTSKNGGPLRDILMNLKNNIWAHDFWHWGWVSTWRSVSWSDFLSMLRFDINDDYSVKGRNFWRDPWAFAWTSTWTRRRMKSYLRAMVNNRAYYLASQESTGSKTKITEDPSLGLLPLTEEAIDTYMYSDNGNLTGKETLLDNNRAQMELTFKIPDYSDSTRTSLVATSDSIVYDTKAYDLKPIDISMDILDGISKFVEQQLEGTGEGDYYVKFVEGMTECTGRKNSLYYQRYLYLNNRMNVLEGPLFAVGRDFRSLKTLQSFNTNASRLVESYSPILNSLDLQEVSELKYFPPQEATATKIQLDNGKFYYQSEMDAFRKAIGDKCVLTCNRCSVKDSCIFYDEKEVLKLYCTPANYISFYVKDNMLDLIVYDNTPGHESPKLVDDDGNSLDIKKLREMHLPYSEISSKKEHGVIEGNSVTYGIRSLQSIRDVLPDNMLTEDLGWLTGARYGTIAKNKTRDLSLIGNAKLDKFEGQELPKYKVLYDALFFKDMESQITYSQSSNDYEVQLEVIENGAKKLYKGTTRIYIPRGLQLLENSDPNADVFLVSDDKMDDSGNTITPVIYINKVKNIKYAFDLADDPKNKEITYKDVVKTEGGDAAVANGHVYAKDVAQWSINTYKGICANNPLYSNDDTTGFDQYWMPTLKKKVVSDDGRNVWVTIPGRKRLPSGYSEALMNPEKFNNALVISGKPAVAKYIDFQRKFLINLGCFKWVYGKSSPLVNSVEEDRNVAFRNAVVRQQSTLPFMKTNLRLVVVNNYRGGIPDFDEEKVQPV